MTNKQKFDRLRKLLDEADVYARAVGKLDFDMQCCAPKDGMEQAGADMAVLSDRYFRLTHTKRYAQLVTELHADSEGLTPVQKKVVAHLYEAWEKEKHPAKLNYEMSLAYNRAYSKWLEAKQAADFSLFRDSLAEIISYTHKALDLRENKKPTYYDALLDDTEKGGSIAQLDAFFDALRARIVPLVRRIQAEGKPIRTDFMSRPCPIPQQEAFSRYLLELEGLKQGRARPHDDRASVHHELRPQGTCASRRIIMRTILSPISSPRSMRAATRCSCRMSRRNFTANTPQTP